jgi:hypothetical protein
MNLANINVALATGDDCSGVLRKKLLRPFHHPHLTSVTPLLRHLERNQELAGWLGSWGPPCNLLVSLLVSLRRSYGRLNAGDEMDVTASSRGISFTPVIIIR